MTLLLERHPRVCTFRGILSNFISARHYVSVWCDAGNTRFYDIPVKRSKNLYKIRIQCLFGLTSGLIGLDYPDKAVGCHRIRYICGRDVDGIASGDMTNALGTGTPTPPASRIRQRGYNGRHTDITGMRIIINRIPIPTGAQPQAGVNITSPLIYNGICVRIRT